MRKHSLLDSFGFAFSGLWQAIKGGCNIKIHLLVATLIILAGFYFAVSNIEWLVLILTISLVLAAEVFNSAIEKTCNVYDEKLKMKYGESALPRNIAAAAVLTLSIASVFIGLIIFLPYILRLFF